ncbi:MAG: transposase [Myxococcales bacterium]|nr:transposase [Myxococcales bacterium]
MRRAAGPHAGRAGSVTVVQRFGGSLNLHVHLHTHFLRASRRPTTHSRSRRTTATHPRAARPARADGPRRPRCRWLDRHRRPPVLP